MTDTRGPGVCGNDSFSVCFFHSSCILRPILKVFVFNCFFVLLFSLYLAKYSL